MKTLENRHREQGFVLLVVYMVVVLISILAFVLFARSNAFAQANERNHNKIIAFNMAEAATDFALVKLAADSNYTGTSSYVSMDTGSVRGGFTVTVTTPQDNTSVRIIQTSGFSPSYVTTDRAYQTSSITTYVQLTSNPLFKYAIFAEDSIVLTDNDKFANVDSYDSRNGTYGANGNVSSDADIAVNSTAEEAIELEGTTLVEGDVYVGTGGNPATGIEIGKKAAITGVSSTLSEPAVYAAPSTSLASQGDKDVHGADEYLSAGAYHFSSLSVTSSLILTGSGTTTIYVDGSVNIAGLGIVSLDNKPPSLIIYVLGSDTVKVAGNGAFYGGIYAPNSKVENTGNGGIYGCVVSKTFDQNSNSSLHFDKAMADIPSNQNSNLSVTAWQEQNSLTWGTGN